VVDGPNLYAYVRQNPWSKFDPLGLQGNWNGHRRGAKWRAQNKIRRQQAKGSGLAGFSRAVPGAIQGAVNIASYATVGGWIERGLDKATGRDSNGIRNEFFNSWKGQIDSGAASARGGDADSQAFQENAQVVELVSGFAMVVPAARALRGNSLADDSAKIIDSASDVSRVTQKFVTKELNGKITVTHKDSGSFFEAHRLDDGSVYLDMIEVAEKVQKQGIGRQLYEKMFGQIGDTSKVRARLDYDNYDSMAGKGKGVIDTHHGKMMDELGYDTKVLSDTGDSAVVESTKR